MIRRPPRSTRTDTLFPYTTLFRSDTRFDTMFRSILSRIPLIYHKDTPPNSSEAEKGLTFDSRLPNGPVSAREASDLLTGVTGTRLLIILDEYDRVADSGFRSEERRVGKACVSRCRSRWSPDH